MGKKAGIRLENICSNFQFMVKILYSGDGEPWSGKVE